MINKIGLYTVICAISLLVSCSSDDESSIVGNWSLTQFKVECPSSGEFFEFTAQNGCVTIENDNTCFSLELKEDGTGLVTVSFDGTSDSYQATYTTTATTLSLCDSSNDCEIFQLNGDQLTLEENEDDCTSQYVFEKN